MRVDGRSSAGAALVAEAEGPARRVGGGMRLLLSNEFGLLALILLFFAVFTLASGGFLSAFNQFTLWRTTAVNAVIGFSMMTVIVTGGLNLAVGAIGVCAAMTCGWLIQSLHMPWPLGIVGALALGAGLGFVNGWTVVKSGLHSFIITLATMSIFFGVMVYLTHGESFRELPPSFSAFGRTRYLSVVSPMLIVAILVGLALIVLYRLTALGREMLAAGASPRAAELSGVRVDRVFIACHMLSGALAGVAALMLVTRNGAAIPSMAGQLGQDWLLPAFLGPVLGGTLLSGGRVSVTGTFLGAALVTVLTSGLLLLRIGEFWVQAALGLILLLAVMIDYARKLYLAHRRMV